jgi:hypothetical protein
LTTTLGNLIDEVSINLAGYTYQQDRATHLTSAVSTTTSSSASPTVLSVGSSDNLGKGIVEIDEELMWIDSFDRVANTATVSPYGRGYLGTTATTHSADTKVTLSPTFPKYVVKRAINDTINAVGSTIYSAKVTTFTFNAAQTTYDFDNLNIQNILTIMWQSVGPSQEWIPVRRWSWDSKADATAFGATSQTVTIGDYITPGRTVKVVYSTDPTSFSELATTTLTNAQVFETVSGLPSSCKDVIILGASYRLLTYLDPARAGQVSPQADETDSKRPYGASQTATKQLYALYTQRLNEETQRQQTLYPIRVHYSR